MTPRARLKRGQRRKTRSILNTAIASSLQGQLYRMIPLLPEQPSVNPGSDFYTFVNGNWLRSVQIPGHMTSYGVSDEIEYVLQSYLYKSIESEKGIANPIRIVADSALHPSSQKKNVSDLKVVMQQFNCINSPEKMASTLGSMARHKILTLLDVYIAPKDGGSKFDHKDYCIHLSIGKLGLPDSIYYRDPQNVHILRSYVNYIKRSVALLDLQKDISSAVPLEARLSVEIDHAEEKMDSKTPSFFHFQELEKEFPQIPWAFFCAGYGIPEEGIKGLSFQVESVDWLKRVAKEFTGLSDLLALHTLLHALPFLPPPFDELHFDVFGRQLLGQKSKIPQKILVTNIIKERLPFQLGRIFMKSFFKDHKAFKSEIVGFVKTIQKAAEDAVSLTEWMESGTRKKASEKVAQMELSVGFSDVVMRGEFGTQGQPALSSLEPDHLLKNVYLLDAALTDFDIQKCFKDSPKGLWADPPYVVNAYYYHETNEIVLPAANFLWPFYRLPAEDWIGWNYGGVGNVIAHEIIHAFDGEGRFFDERGRVNSWWSAADEKHYSRETKKLVELFGRKRVAGKKISGQTTLDENLADLGGVSISLNALKKELRRKQQHNTLSEDDCIRHLRDFFISYAVSWRTKESKARRIERVATDQHAPFELRVNLIVSQFQEWYDVFQIKASHPLYVAPRDRIKIF